MSLVGLCFAAPSLVALYKLARVTALLPTVAVGPDMFQHLEAEASIPAIIHHLSKSSEIKPEWDLSYRSSFGVHGRYANQEGGGRYRFELWDDERMKAFVKAQFPDYYHTWKRYRYKIERVDAARVLILLKYGGIYLDLDVGCRRSLDNLRRAEGTRLLLPMTKPLGVSNDFIMSAPGHPFLQFVADRLAARSHETTSLLPFFSVLWSTGPLFLSVCLYDYLSGASHETSIALLSSHDYTKTLLYHLPGSSWLGMDGKLILYIWYTVLPGMWTVVSLIIKAFVVLVFLGGFVALLARASYPPSATLPPHGPIEDRDDSHNL